jgi:hypothetical protein
MKVYILILFLFICSSSTFAQFWAGGHINVAYWDTHDTKDVNGAHEGYALNGGYRFNNYLGLESFYKWNKWRTPQFDQDPNNRMSILYYDHMIGAGARGYYKWLSATAGVAFHHVTTEISFINSSKQNETGSYDTIRPYAGGGFVVPHYPNIQPYGEVIYYPAKDFNLIDFVIGGRYYF